MFHVYTMAGEIRYNMCYDSKGADFFICKTYTQWDHGEKISIKISDLTVILDEDDWR